MAGRGPLASEIIPHPRYRGEWLLKPTRGAPFGLWYRDRAHAVSYAEWDAFAPLRACRALMLRRLSWLGRPRAALPSGQTSSILVRAG